MTAEDRTYLERYRRPGWWKSFLRLFRRAAGEAFDRAIEADLAGGQVELLEVEASGLATGTPSDDARGPFLLLDTGDGHVLCLAGEWLVDPHVVPDEIEEAGETDEDAGGVWFRSFVLRRARRSGIPLALRPADRRDLVRAARRVPAGELPFFGETAIIDGTLGDEGLARVLERLRAIERRIATGERAAEMD